MLASLERGSMYKVSYKAARVNAELSPEEACEALGIKSRTTLWKLENGTDVPSPDLLQRMSEVYQVPIENLKY